MFLGAYQCTLSPSTVENSRQSSPATASPSGLTRAMAFAWPTSDTPIRRPQGKASYFPLFPTKNQAPPPTRTKIPTAARAQPKCIVASPEEYDPNFYFNRRSLVHKYKSVPFLARSCNPVCLTRSTRVIFLGENVGTDDLNLFIDLVPSRWVRRSHFEVQT